MTRVEVWFQLPAHQVWSSVVAFFGIGHLTVPRFGCARAYHKAGGVHECAAARFAFMRDVGGGDARLGANRGAPNPAGLPHNAGHRAHSEFFRSMGPPLP